MKTENPEQIDVQKLVMADKEARFKACLKDIQETLQKHRCELVGAVTIVGSQIGSEVRIVPKP